MLMKTLVRFNSLSAQAIVQYCTVCSYFWYYYFIIIIIMYCNTIDSTYLQIRRKNRLELPHSLGISSI